MKNAVQARRTNTQTHKHTNIESYNIDILAGAWSTIEMEMTLSFRRQIFLPQGGGISHLLNSLDLTLKV